MMFDRLSLLSEVGTVDELQKDSICRRASAAFGMSTDEARSTFDDLILFLSAGVVWPYAGFNPPEQMDAVWHEFILHTQAYIKFCKSLGVDYIHHIPHGTSEPDTLKAQEVDLFDILSDLGVTFNAKIWQDAKSQCNGCDRAIEFTSLQNAAALN